MTARWVLIPVAVAALIAGWLWLIRGLADTIGGGGM